MTTDDAHGDPLPPDGAAAATVVAAGGVVLEGSGADRRVLVVHRPAYDDWTLPKGHVDPGEDVDAAALREVVEETGVRARIVREAGSTEHLVRLREGEARKVVHWFVMRPDGADSGDPARRAPDDEVDHVEWWPTDVALRRLTHVGDRSLLSRVVDSRVGDAS